MQHLNPYRFYELAAKLHGLCHANAATRIADLFGPLTETQAALDALIKGDPFPLETSRSDATRLLDRLAQLFNRHFIDPVSRQLKPSPGEDERLDPHELAPLSAALQKFEHALAAEMTYSPTYTASKRGIYATYDLVENAHKALPEDIRAAVPPAALPEMAAAGRALAFGLGAAAAMHLLRAIEIVLRAFHESFTGTPAPKAERNYSLYLKKLAALADDESQTRRPDKRLLQMLAQIKDHYRNPLLGPDSTVSPEQATSLFALATAVITLMAEPMIAMRKSGSEPTPGSAASKTSAEASRQPSLPTLAKGEGEESYDFRLAQAG